MKDPRIDPISPEERAEPVVVVPYDPAWAAAFAQLRERLAAGLGELAIGIEHVGSTAVPGLDAKPIVDIDVVIRRAGALPDVALRLAELGYTHLGDLGIVGRANVARDAEHVTTREVDSDDGLVVTVIDVDEVVELGWGKLRFGGEESAVP